MNCSICGQPAHVLDLEHDVAYCDLHADERRICAGDHDHLAPTITEPGETP